MPKQIETIGQEQCWLKFALTDSNLEEGVFKGIASVFGSLVQSWMPTVLVPGAFTKTIRESGHKVKLLHQHEMTEPIGKPLSLSETAAGLMVEGKISQTSRGKDDLILIRDGVIDELSIGFDPIDGKQELLPLSKAIEQGYLSKPEQWAEYDENEMVRILREVRLWEISLVTWAADPMAKIQSVHAVVPYQDLPLADEDRAWDAGAAHGRMVDACGLNGDAPDWAKFKKGHLWFDADGADKITGYKFLIADIIDGKMLAVPRGLFAAAGVLQGARGGTKVPEADQAKMKAHLARYYKKMDRTPPWEENKDSIELVLEMLYGFMPPAIEAHEGKVLSAKNKKLLSDAMAVLQALIAAAEPPDNDQALTVNAEQLNRLAELQMWLAQSPN